MPFPPVDQFLEVRNAFRKNAAEQKAQAEAAFAEIAVPTILLMSEAFAAYPYPGVRLNVLETGSRHIKVDYVPIPIPSSGNRELTIGISEDGKSFECSRFGNWILIKDLIVDDFAHWVLAMLKRLDPDFNVK